ncbi:hypothetical protein HYH02_006884 [Chlamydomonas schloesseri]|uniref:ARC6 IMS domain-containing protein n=1 Tax=Chlamydomonas schloesseri TaxID=2026947 RepID=A0A835WIY5_9CHLO|nr:hypothetical protein HYH02_006884 [Chlamydomonas schloesseri]|eukprot:KAG2448300.1 hypothetical protein HYH02_006884 [Chlamydomonas schloesseri]
MQTTRCFARIGSRQPSLRVAPTQWRAAHIAPRFRPSDTNVELSNSIVRIPLEAPELLGLPKTAIFKDSELNSIYEELVTTAVQAEYSHVTINARLEVLDYARRDVINNKGRVRDSNDLDIPIDLLPGAIALMAEVGQCDLAISVGSELLASPEGISPLVAKDVRLSIALANCYLAGNCLEEGQISQGCAYLEAALQTLEGAGEPALAPTLAGEIRASLASFRFKAAMETVSAPLGVGKVAEARKRALRTLRDAIRAQSATAASQQDPLASLSALSNLSNLSSLANFSSLSNLMTGAAARGPAASGTSAAASSASTATAAPGPVTAEAMEALMGMLTCEEVVELLEWEQVARTQASLNWYYQGLLEGVSVAHIVHGFTHRQPAYVKMGLSLVQELPSNPDLCVVEAVCHVLLGAVQQAEAALKQAGKGNPASDRVEMAELTNGALPASRDAYRFVVAVSKGSDDGLLPGLCMLTERWLTQAAFPFFRDTASPEMEPACLVRYFDDTRVETLLTVYDSKSGAQLAEAALGEAFTAIKKVLRTTAEAGLLASGAVPASEIAADPELAARQRLYRQMAGGFALVAAVAMGLMTPPGQRLIGRGEGAQVALMRQRSTLVPCTVAVEDFDVTTARELLEQWQAAKAWALGLYHTTDQLPSILAEPLLSETLDKVNTLRGHGAHMRFKLQRLQVTGLKRVTHKGAPAFRITAVLEESADLHNDADGKPVKTCRRIYDADYTAARGKDGVWRMANSIVTERAA